MPLLPFSRKANRRVVLRRQAFYGALDEAWAALSPRLLFVGKLLLAAGLVVGGVFSLDRGVRHVVASPRFAVADIRIVGATRARTDEIHDLLGATAGDRLLALDTAAMAERLRSHPWIKDAKVRRELPSALVVEIIERQAAAVAAFEALYLVDADGHPFKRATPQEAAGLVILSGVERDRFVAAPDIVEAAFREALILIRRWRDSPGRPALSEVSLDGRTGLTAHLLDSGAEIVFGRGLLDRKLADFDRIVAHLGAKGPAELGRLRVVHLDLVEADGRDRIPVRLAQAPATSAAGAAAGATGSGAVAAAQR